MAGNTDCLYTTIQNISRAEAVFSFIPPHGKRMAAGEMLTVAGNMIDRLAAKTSNRQFKAMENALMGDPTPSPGRPNGIPPSLAIISTPAVFVMTQEGVPADPAHSVAAVPPKGQVLTGMEGGTDDTLGMTDPCWGPQEATDLPPISSR